jgi:hypothetical protein
VKVEVKLRLPDVGAYSKVASLLAASKTTSFAQVCIVQTVKSRFLDHICHLSQLS